MEANKKKVIIDTDPGVDDALALILALRSPELHIEAITTVNGNTALHQCTENALRILEILAPSDPPPVIPGAARPLTREPVPSASIHGRDGLGEITFLKVGRGKKKYPPPRRKPEPAHASKAIIELVNKCPGQITIITLGPLTNIALALEADPSLKRRIKEIVAMGGAYSVPGNITPAAEFNFFCDPEAAQDVINSGIPITLVGLDVTRNARLSRQSLMKATKKRMRLNQFLRDSTEHVMNFYRQREGYHGCCVHDALAVMAAVDASIIGTKRTRVEIETKGALTSGMSVADLRPYARGKTGDPNATIALYVDSARFEQLLLERITDA